MQLSASSTTSTGTTTARTHTAACQRHRGNSCVLACTTQSIYAPCSSSNTSNSAHRGPFKNYIIQIPGREGSAKR